jgi:hypothetical protein
LDVKEFRVQMHSMRCSGLEMKGSGTKVAVIAIVEVTAETSYSEINYA